MNSFICRSRRKETIGDSALRSTESQTGRGLPHSKTWRDEAALLYSRQRLGVRQSSAAFGRRNRPRWASLALTFLWLLGLTTELLAQPAAKENPIQFCAVDIYVDSGSKPLAAYQLEFAATNGTVKIAGIEGGEHAAFRQPPFYDPKALQHERVILAAFSTAAANQLPTGKTRVATLHLQITGAQPPQFELKLHTAGGAQGTPIPVQASFAERKTQ